MELKMKNDHTNRILIEKADLEKKMKNKLDEAG